MYALSWLQWYQHCLLPSWLLPHLPPLCCPSLPTQQPLYRCAQQFLVHKDLEAIRWPAHCYKFTRARAAMAPERLFDEASRSQAPLPMLCGACATTSTSLRAGTHEGAGQTYQYVGSRGWHLRHWFQGKRPVSFANDEYFFAEINHIVMSLKEVKSQDALCCERISNDYLGFKLWPAIAIVSCLHPQTWSAVPSAPTSFGPVQGLSAEGFCLWILSQMSVCRSVTAAPVSMTSDVGIPATST